MSVVEGTEPPPIEHVLETPGRLTIQLRDDSGAQLSGVVDIRRVDADARPPGVPEGLLEALAATRSPLTLRLVVALVTVSAGLALVNFAGRRTPRPAQVVEP